MMAAYLGLQKSAEGCMRCGRYWIVGRGVQTCGCPRPRGDGFGGPRLPASIQLICTVCGPLVCSWNDVARRREVRRDDGSRHLMRQCPPVGNGSDSGGGGAGE